MMTTYDARDWFWIINGDVSKAWSSGAGAYVTDFDPEKTTAIASEAELSDVLRPYGLTLPAPTQDDYAVAVQSKIDQVARSRGYTDGVSLASYKNSTNAQWGAEATAFIAWRDGVWGTAYTALAAAQGGGPVPTIEDVLSSLPQITWPA